MGERADEWISTGRAAKRLGVSTRTLRRYTRDRTPVQDPRHAP